HDFANPRFAIGEELLDFLLLLVVQIKRAECPFDNAIRRSSGETASTAAGPRHKAATGRRRVPLRTADSAPGGNSRTSRAARPRTPRPAPPGPLRRPAKPPPPPPKPPKPAPARASGATEAATSPTETAARALRRASKSAAGSARTTRTGWATEAGARSAKTAS